MRAAVLNEIGDTKLEVRDDAATTTPGPGEVRVRIRATGVCHSDLSAMNGTLPVLPPAVLGHEGCGEIVEVGEGVTSVGEGDRVVVVWIPPCGECRYCLGGQPNLCSAVLLPAATTPRFKLGDTDAFGFVGTGTFAEYTVLPEQAVQAIPADVPFEVGALIGCGVTTGVGSVINTAAVRPGSSVAVIGCGGVGISAIQGARLAGAAEIVAVDLVERKRDWAREFGATHAVSPDDLGDLSGELTAGEGFDYVFEVVGRAPTIRAAYEATRRGGTTVVVGAGAEHEIVEFNAYELFFNERTLKGAVYGSADVRVDFDRIIRLWRAGRLDLEGMITRRLTLEQVNDGLEALESGEVIRQVIEL